MKKLFFFILPLTLFSYELKFSKEFSTELRPDVLSSNFRIQIEDDSELEVASKLEVFNKEIKSFKKIDKKLGNLNVRPNYKYSSNNTPKIISYIGSLNYEISSLHASYINEFISKMNALKNNRDTSIIISGLSWKIKNTSRNVAKDLLRFEAISWVTNYATNISHSLEKSCTTKSISIANNAYAYRNRSLNTSYASAEKSSIAIPEMNSQKVAINTNYVLECK